jgi:hypothetical protein
MKERAKFKRRGKIVSRWSAVAAAAPVRLFAETFSQKAREAFAETDSLTVEHCEIKLKRLPPALDGLRVVQLTDVHHSPFTEVEQINRAVEIANGLEADLMVLTGDYVSHEIEYIAPVAEMMGKLKAKHGIFAVLGNHDHYTDAEFLTKCFREEGITVLINEGLRFEKDGAKFWLCGVDDTLNFESGNPRQNRFSHQRTHARRANKNQAGPRKPIFFRRSPNERFASSSRNTNLRFARHRHRSCSGALPMPARNQSA